MRCGRVLDGAACDAAQHGLIIFGEFFVRRVAAVPLAEHFYGSAFAERLGEGVAEMNQQVLANLDKMIGELENDNGSEAADAG